ncbi:MAG: hypothetical protein MUE93_00520 [Ignavibacteriaceae bacterium]|nr:hypothetical protein [Ignavibacteriaceae bacterium]MCU0364146.1 hypothetical protein [Ignavibacteriaceae bacterium]MCU0405443.1 hypothetical protein [Ignavibacteriaceae bacterium]MCU0413828.1 hypothetical protein [Ignavibacteriaceae bacterium]
MKKIALALIILTVSFSCREEIIEPNNLVGNINEPIQVRERNSYALLLDAKNLTMSLSVPLYFSAAKTRFNVRLFGYESGYTNISVQDISKIERFRYLIAEEVSYHTELLDGYVPTTININMENFSGKISIEFRKIF